MKHPNKTFQQIPPGEQLVFALVPAAPKCCFCTSRNMLLSQHVDAAIRRSDPQNFRGGRHLPLREASMKGPKLLKNDLEEKSTRPGKHQFEYAL